MSRKRTVKTKETPSLQFNAVAFALLLFFSGKPVMDLCIHFFKWGADMELCETIKEEDGKEKEADDLEEEESKIMVASVLELSNLLNSKSKVFHHFLDNQSDFKSGVQTPPPEYIFNA